MKIELQSVVVTSAIAAEIPPDRIAAAIKRHAQGDWGEISEEDKLQNDASCELMGQVLSVYEYDGKKFWIITDSGWLATTVLFPEEY